MAARPRYGSSASAVAFTSSSNSATSTMRRGAAASSRRATACPTSPLPPKIIAVRSRSSMESLDGLAVLRREAPVLALGESPQTHRSIRHAVEPLDLQPQRVGQPPHDALPALREGDLYLDARSGGPNPRVEHPHGTAVDRGGARQRGPQLPRAEPVRAQPVRPRHRVPRVHQPVRRRPVRRQEQEPRGITSSPPTDVNPGNLGGKAEAGRRPPRSAPATTLATRL